jgi:putative addiction module component (TIGR02574 family)
MSELFSSLGIDRLPVTEQLQLAREILDGVDTPPTTLPPLTSNQQQELLRRLALLEADPKNASPWEEVEARILDGLSK